MAPVTTPLTAADALAQAWDAAVLGAGVAGLAVAHGLARRGFAVLLVDQHAFPREKVCGGCLSARSVALLGALGLEAALADAEPIEAFAFQAGGRRLTQPLPPGRAISRRTLDAGLLALARAAGVAWLPATPARLHGESVYLGHHPEPLRARLVIDARGLAAAGPPEPGSRIGVGATLPANALVQLPAAGAIAMHWHPRGYVGAVRVERGHINLAAALDPAVIRDAGGLAPAMARLCAEAGLPLAGAEAIPWRATPPLTRRGMAAGPRLFRLGDATGYVEPFTGEGMGWALAAAQALQPLAAEALRRGWQPADAARWQTALRALLVRRQAACRLFSAGLRHPALVAGACWAARMPQVFHHFSRRINGPWTPAAPAR